MMTGRDTFIAVQCGIYAVVLIILALTVPTDWKVKFGLGYMGGSLLVISFILWGTR